MKYIFGIYFFIMISGGLRSQVSCDCGENGVLDAGAGYSTYLWSDGSTMQTLTIDPLCPSDAGSYSVTVTDACGTDTDTQSFTVCNASSATLNPVFYNNGTACIIIGNVPTCCKNPEYRWTDPCGSIVTTNRILQSGGPNGINNITVCGIYTFEIVSCNGCTECSSSITIDIQAPNNGLVCCGGTCGCTSCTANISSWANSLICNQQGTYTASTCIGATYDWEVTQGGVVVATGSGSTFNWTPTINGTFTIELEVIDDCGIITTDQVNTTVVGCTNNCDDCSTITIGANNTPSCGINTVFSFNCPSATNISWSITGGGGTPNGSTFTYAPTSNGTYTVQSTWTDGCGNIITDDFTFTISNCTNCQDCTASNIVPNSTPSCNLATTYNISCSNTSTFNWSITGGGGTSNGSSFTYTPTANGNYTITVTFTDQCGNNLSKSYAITINDCVNCDCSVSMTYNDTDCQMEYTVTGCTSWQLRYSSSPACTGTSTVASGTFDVINQIYDIQAGNGNGYYEIVALETGCPFQQTNCIEADCVCQPVANLNIGGSGLLNNKFCTYVDVKFFLDDFQNPPCPCTDVPITITYDYEVYLFVSGGTNISMNSGTATDVINLGQPYVEIPIDICDFAAGDIITIDFEVTGEDTDCTWSAIALNQANLSQTVTQTLLDSCGCP